MRKPHSIGGGQAPEPRLLVSEGSNGELTLVPWATKDTAPESLSGAQMHSEDPADTAPLKEASLREAAVAAGFDAGMQKAEASLDALRHRFDASIALLEGVVASLHQDNETRLLDLALSVAQQIIGTDLAASRQFTDEMVGHVCKELRSADSLTIRVSPDDVERVLSVAGQLASESCALKVIGDPELEEGGVIADSELGTIDGSLRRRVGDIGESLRARVAQPEADPELML